MGEITGTNPDRRSGLQIPQEEAEKRITAQIKQGINLLTWDIHSVSDLQAARQGKKRWDQYNIELLKRIADPEQFLAEYYQPFGFISPGGTSFDVQKEEYQAEVKGCIDKLSSIRDRLVLIYELDLLREQKINEPENLLDVSKKIFIVHGHDQGAKLDLARFLEKIDLEPVILHEHPNQGRTIINKFEDHSNAAYAVVLLTPDDVGGRVNDPEDLQPRARQNVVFELGFMIGALGRERVCALHKGEVEIPSDFSGVLWIGMDTEGAWQLKLAREIKAVGIEVDLNRLL